MGTAKQRVLQSPKILGAESLMSFPGQKPCTCVVAFLLLGGKCDQCKPEGEKGEKGKTFCGFLQIPMYLFLWDPALHPYCMAVIHSVTTLLSPRPFSTGSHFIPLHVDI